MVKNKLTYFRQGKVLMGEFITAVIYFGVLTALAITVTTSLFPPIPLQPIAPLIQATDTDPANSLYPAYMLTLGCVPTTDQPECTPSNANIGFSDTPDGCSSTLSSFISTIPICQETFTDKYFTPSCLCIPSNATSSHITTTSFNLTAALIFHDTSVDFANFTNFTIMADFPTSEKQTGDSQFHSWTFGPYNPDFGHIPFILPSIYDAIYAKSSASEHTAFSLNSKPMGNLAYETSNIGAMFNFPWYITALFTSGVATVVVEIVKERERQCDAGLFMCGLSPYECE